MQEERVTESKEKQCKRGHIAAKRYSNGGCVECGKERAARWRQENPERMKALRADYDEKDPMRRAEQMDRYRKSDKCKERKKAWRVANPKQRKAEKLAYRERHKERLRFEWRARRALLRAHDPVSIREKDRIYRAKNVEGLKAKRKIYISRNRPAFSAYSANRRSLERKAMPIWADKQQIVQVYETAKRLTEETGVKHHVDHVIPLVGKDSSGDWIVCGLHVHYNLAVIPWFENMAKGCRFSGEGWEAS